MSLTRTERCHLRMSKRRRGTTMWNFLRQTGINSAFIRSNIGRRRLPKPLRPNVSEESWRILLRRPSKRNASTECLSGPTPKPPQPENESARSSSYMPWLEDADSLRHNKLARGRRGEIWRKVANETLERTGDEGRAICEANAVIDRIHDKGALTRHS